VDRHGLRPRDDIFMQKKKKFDPKIGLSRYMFYESYNINCRNIMMDYWENGMNWGITLLAVAGTMYLCWVFGG